MTRAWTPEDLLPHRGGALLLEAILEVSEARCVAQARVAPGAWYLQADGSAPAWLGLEWMAQAASAFSGHRHLRAGRPPRVGFLLGTQAYACEVPAFPVEGVYEVSAEVLFLDEDGVGAFACEVRQDGRSLARARLKAVEVP